MIKVRRESTYETRDRLCTELPALNPCSGEEILSSFVKSKCAKVVQKCSFVNIVLSVFE